MTSSEGAGNPAGSETGSDAGSGLATDLAASPAVSPAVIEIGPEPVLTQRPMPWRMLASVAALLVAAGIGYVVGDRHGRTSATSQANRTAASAASESAATEALDMAATGVTCSEQLGTTLRLGARLANRSTRPITLDGIGVELPGDGLELVGTAWGECIGAASAPPAGITLAPGEATWVSAIVAVKVPCPDSYPVIFQVNYDNDRATVRAGFNDLQGVPYTGCNRSSR
ncbi:MAG TPA: hypothetical protein VFR11_10340 [Micromonosporaceae bacterium]|nr:hypothetical protein [Micromonosporaceae bacterium]